MKLRPLVGCVEVRNPGCHCGRNCQLLIQEFAVNVDQGFLMAIIALFSSGDASEEQTTTEFRRDCGMVDQSLMEDTSQMVSAGVQNYFDHLQCSPIKVCLDRVLSHWAHFTVHRFIFVCVLLCVHCMQILITRVQVKSQVFLGKIQKSQVCLPNIKILEKS